MKKVLLLGISLLWVTNLLVLSGCSQTKPKKVNEEVQEHPAPLKDPSTDSLKQMLDRQRKNR